MTSDDKFCGPVKKCTIIETGAQEHMQYRLYDKDGYLTEYLADDGLYKLYYRDGLCVKEVWYVGESEASISFLDYNNKRQIISRRTVSEFETYLTEYLYDRKNRLMKELSYKIKDAQKVVFREHEYKYSYMGFLAAEDITKNSETDHIRYDYDEDGKYCLRKRFLNPDYSIAEEKYYYYDSEERIIQIIRTIPLGDEYFAFTYDAIGNCVREEHIDSIGHNYITQRLFDSHNNCIRESKFRQNEINPYSETFFQIEYY